MDGKKIIGLVFILGALVLTGVLVFKSLSLGKKTAPVSSQTDLKDGGKIDPNDNELVKALKGVKEEEQNTANAIGKIETVDEKTLTIKQVLGNVVINFDAAASVVTINGQNQESPGKSTDLKVGDSVVIVYDRTTKNAIKISVTRS